VSAYVFPGQGAQHRGMGAALSGATRRAVQIEAQSDVKPPRSGERAA